MRICFYAEQIPMPILILLTRAAAVGKRTVTFDQCHDNLVVLHKITDVLHKTRDVLAKFEDELPGLNRLCIVEQITAAIP